MGKGTIFIISLPIDPKHKQCGEHTKEIPEAEQVEDVLISGKKT